MHDIRRISLHLGVNTAILLVSSILVGYGTYVSWNDQYIRTVYHVTPPTSDLIQHPISHIGPSFLVSLVSQTLGIDYFRAVALFWLLGVLGMIGGLMGIVNVVRRIVVHALYGRKHYATD